MDESGKFNKRAGPNKERGGHFFFAPRYTPKCALCQPEGFNSNPTRIVTQGVLRKRHQMLMMFLMQSDHHYSLLKSHFHRTSGSKVMIDL